MSASGIRNYLGPRVLLIRGVNGQRMAPLTTSCAVPVSSWFDMVRVASLYISILEHYYILL
jgi:hypothetical protein